jgi:hypothetical protein
VPKPIYSVSSQPAETADSSSQSSAAPSSLLLQPASSSSLLQMTQMPDNNTNNTQMMQQIHQQQQQHGFNSPLQIIPTGQLCHMQPQPQHQLQPDLHTLQSPNQNIHSMTIKSPNMTESSTLQQQHQHQQPIMHAGFQLIPDQHQVIYPYNMSPQLSMMPSHHHQQQPHQQNMSHMPKSMNFPQLIVSPGGFSAPLIAVNTNLNIQQVQQQQQLQQQQQHPAGLNSPYILTAVAPTPMQSSQNFNTTISPLSTTPSSFNSSSPSTSNSPTNNRQNNPNNPNVQSSGNFNSTLIFNK